MAQEQEQPVMNKLEAYQAQLAQAAQIRAAERSQRDQMIAEARARRAHFEQTGESVPPAPSLHDVFTANREQLQAQEKEQRQQVKSDQYALNLHSLPQPPHVVEAWKRDYFAQLNADEV